MSSVGELLAASAKARVNGAPAEAATLLADALSLHQETKEPVPKSSYYELGLLLYELKRYTDAEPWLRIAIDKQPKDFATVNLMGVVLRRLGRYPDALKWLDQAQKLNPRSVSPLANKANVLIAMGDGPRAMEVLRKAVRQEPKVAEHHRMLGVAYRLTGDLDGARQKLQVALSLDPRNVQTWIDQAGVLQELQRSDQSLALLDDALRILGELRPLVESKIKLLRSAGRVADAEAWTVELLERYPDAGWLHYRLGRSIAPRDREHANQHFREAVRLSPEPSMLTELADSLDRTRGTAEAANIQEGYEVAKRRLELGGDVAAEAKVLHNIFFRVADYEAAGQFGGFAAMGRRYIAQNEIAGLHYLLGHARSTEDRLLLVDLHRTWGKRVDARAARSPIRQAPAIVGRAKIRIGFVSSDLRHHPVSYFTLPLLEGYNRSRFEVYCYSWFTRAEDNVQKHITRIVDGFRLRPHIGARDAAQLIADDQVDALFELGGSTDMNKLEVMSWRPALRQASWLGYPHSAGLETIDRILVDPFLKPPLPALLIEKPFELAHSWVTLGRLGFDDREPITPGTPEERKGHLTFGTANACYKYNIELLRAWAEILRCVEGSRFVFLRPEGAVPAFVTNIRRHFEDNGVAGDRIEFIAVRGTHMRHYNEIDIALDTFPHVGGTTTCESLWMAVPTITVAGEAFFERMSYSNLNNAGLGDLCATTREGYVDIAVALARDGTRRAELRRTMRERLRAHPIGRADIFVADFQDAIVRWMDETGGMKAVILAGGRGTRLAEESAVRPKPMVEIGGRPILWHIMKIYAAHGITDFVVCLGYKGLQIKEYFVNYRLYAADVSIDLATGGITFERSAAEPWRVTLVDTGEDTQTGGRLKRIADRVAGDDAFCMTYGDGVADVNVGELIAFHRRHGHLATVTAVRPPGRFGALDRDGATVRAFMEKPRGDGGTINGGFFVLSPRCLDRIDGDATVWEQEPLESLARDGELAAFDHDGFWQPMDTLRDRDHLERLWASGAAPWKVW